MGIILLPLFLGIVTFILKGHEHRIIRRKLLITGALLHNAGVVTLFFVPDFFSFSPYIQVDKIGFLFLILTSFIFTLIAFYSLGYFPLKRLETAAESGGHIFVSCMLFFLAAMTLAISTTHVGILWIAVESTTLASAPLIYYRQSKRSLEAAWKYLLICSVGIAIALLGIFFVAAASKGTGSELSLQSLTKNGMLLNKQLLRMGFILILIGFGTKMGLAPMHNWLPDAHSEAPSPISALLSGALLNCAFLGVLRFYQICESAGLEAFANKLFIFFGLFSLFMAAIFITAQKDYKRLLAYSSIEHMGIIALSIGIGANFAGMLHVVAHSLTKVLLFLAAGNILILYRTKYVSEVNGLLRTSPSTGILFAIGGLAIAGAPPFLPFISEFLVLKHGLLTGHYYAMFLYLLFLGVIFVSMSKTVFRMVYGKKRDLIWGELPKTMFVPLAAAAAAIVMLGIYLPEKVALLIETAGQALKI
ncbi:MAG: NADH dehydrogenase FAD-containing subunit [Deltaproteobacteria bacterium]|nr:NADH dehydrogenase FAD-containing subunit [Deltaproteobacteria bacterium]MBI2974814.1 NADH dehydrogenase FAD-containing subunit [Deltaproteobacteria bacterium]